jgi:hypothetical protein
MEDCYDNLKQFFNDHGEVPLNEDDPRVPKPKPIGGFGTYFCPKCDEEVEVRPDQDSVTCSHCQSSLRVDSDASFDDGIWHDRTKLFVV